MSCRLILFFSDGVETHQCENLFLFDTSCSEQEKTMEKVYKTVSDSSWSDEEQPQSKNEYSSAEDLELKKEYARTHLLYQWYL